MNKKNKKKQKQEKNKKNFASAAHFFCAFLWLFETS